MFGEQLQDVRGRQEDRSRKGCGGDHVHPHVPPIPSPCWPPCSGISALPRITGLAMSVWGYPKLSSSPDRTGRCDSTQPPCLPHQRGVPHRASTVSAKVVGSSLWWSRLEPGVLMPESLGSLCPSYRAFPSPNPGMGGGWIPRPFHPHRPVHAVCSSSPASRPKSGCPQPQSGTGLDSPYEEGQRSGASPAVTSRQGEKLAGRRAGEGLG